MEACLGRGVLGEPLRRRTPKVELREASVNLEVWKFKREARKDQESDYKTSNIFTAVSLLKHQVSRNKAFPGRKLTIWPK